MGTASEAARDAETVELMDYGFSLYQKRVPVRSGKPAALIPVRFEDQDLPAVSRVPVRIGVREGEDLTVTLDLPDEVEGPIARGERIGTATVRVDGELIRSVPLFAARRVAEPGIFERTIGAITSNLAYIALLLSVILGMALLYRRRKERELKNRLSRAGRRRR
jgi:D-alanyl-D-alanine carboxypeptidase (penicillin-binding protein 5/6)